MRNEERYLTGVELRAEGDEPERIVGHVAVFNSLSKAGAVAPGLLGFRERILPGAFSDSLKKKNARALVQHNPEKVLASAKTGTLRLQEQERGLWAEIDPPNTTLGRDTKESVRRGDLDAFSFSFRTPREKDQTWLIEKGETIRELRTLDLVEISLTAFPVYEATAAELRSLLGAVSIDYEALARALVRNERGLAFLPEDRAAIESTLRVLQKILPEERAQKRQTVIFAKEQWTAAEARKWLEEHELATDKMDEMEKTLRFRQFDPELCREGSFLTLSENMPAGVRIVTCDRQEGERSLSQDEHRVLMDAWQEECSRAEAEARVRPMELLRLRLELKNRLHEKKA